MGYGRESILERPGMLMGCFGMLSAMFATYPNTDILSRQESRAGLVLRQGGNWPRLIDHPEVGTGHGYSVNALVCTSPNERLNRVRSSYWVCLYICMSDVCMYVCIIIVWRYMYMCVVTGMYSTDTPYICKR